MTLELTEDHLEGHEKEPGGRSRDGTRFKHHFEASRFYCSENEGNVTATFNVASHFTHFLRFPREPGWLLHNATSELLLVSFTPYTSSSSSAIGVYDTDRGLYRLVRRWDQYDSMKGELAEAEFGDLVGDYILWVSDRVVMP